MKDARLTRRQWLTGDFVPDSPNLKSAQARTGHPDERGSNNSDQQNHDERNDRADSRRHGLFPVFRPPGAIGESEFLASCTRCGDCIAACPYEAIRIAPASFRSAAGTPVIDAYAQPCWMCSDQPCVTACNTGALLPDAPVAIGTAAVDKTTCLAWQKNFCTVCHEQCPVPGAIELEIARPQINPLLCTGCGVCLYVCPAPAKSILLTPKPISS